MMKRRRLCVMYVLHYNIAALIYFVTLQTRRVEQTCFPKITRHCLHWVSISSPHHFKLRILNRTTPMMRSYLPISSQNEEISVLLVYTKFLHRRHPRGTSRLCSSGLHQGVSVLAFQVALHSASPLARNENARSTDVSKDGVMHNKPLTK